MNKRSENKSKHFFLDEFFAMLYLNKKHRPRPLSENIYWAICALLYPFHSFIGFPRFIPNPMLVWHPIAKYIPPIVLLILYNLHLSGYEEGNCKSCSEWKNWADNIWVWQQEKKKKKKFHPTVNNEHCKMNWRTI